jgi:hypothetical protein
MSDPGKQQVTTQFLFVGSVMQRCNSSFSMDEVSMSIALQGQLQPQE